ncbi:unnamed protein product [Cochlearia groenlandica]
MVHDSCGLRSIDLDSQRVIDSENAEYERSTFDEKGSSNPNKRKTPEIEIDDDGDEVDDDDATTNDKEESS